MRLLQTYIAFVLLVGTAQAETLADIGARLGRDTQAAYEASPYLGLAKDFTSRYPIEVDAHRDVDELAVSEGWTISAGREAAPAAIEALQMLQRFLKSRMGIQTHIASDDPAYLTGNTPAQHIVLALEPAQAKEPESYTIVVTEERVRVSSESPSGLRDGVVRLIDRMGNRGAPFLKKGIETRTPRLPVRLGTVPWGGGYRDLVMMGYNAVQAGGGSLYALSTSDAIPELAVRRDANAPEANRAAALAAKAFGLKTFAFLNTQKKFPKDDPVFQAHPEIRGALTWKADGEYVLCTEHPLVQQWLEESIEGLFKQAPLDGVVIIIGGEGFYHCFMRPFGVEKGHTNCLRCEAVGAEQVVANMVNRMAAAARRVNPEAEVVIWPYSAEHVWSADKTQEKLIEKLEPGVALLTEIEKDEFVEKPEGVRKHLWDYSIDLIGPGERAKAQIAACQKRGIPCYLKSEPECAFEAPRLPHVPSLDRWWDRAEALASCGATGAWVFPAFRPVFGTSATEVNKQVWWEPHPDKDAALMELATRMGGGAEAGGHIRAAWRKVSEAIPWSPELPSYYTGPYYLGPAQPMIADPTAPVPDVFNGYYLFMAEISDDEGMKKRPTYYTTPTGNVPVFTKFYRQMESLLKKAAEHMDAAAPLVPERCRVQFDAENSSIQWFYRTVRTEANFYRSCMIRDRVLALAQHPSRSPEEVKEAQALLDEWAALLINEKENTEAALPIVEADPRLDCYYGGDHTFSHAGDMIKAKLEILKTEMEEFLPGLRGRVE